MTDLNLVCVIGRLGKDPEVRYMPNGDAAVNISLAVGKKWKDRTTGEMKEQTTWVPFSFFGKTAELIGQYAKKGSQMRANGEFSVRKYNDRETGVEKYVTEVRGQDFQLLGARSDDAGGQRPAAAPAARAPAPARAPAAAPAGGGYGAMDDDIPFAPMRGPW